MTNPTPPRTAKAKRRRHTKEFKQEAILLARRADVGFARAAKDLGIHESLLRSWSKAQATEGADAFRGQGKRQLWRRSLPGWSVRTGRCRWNGTS